MIKRLADLFLHRELADEIHRLSRLPPIAKIIPDSLDPERSFSCEWSDVRTWLHDCKMNGEGICGMIAAIEWQRNGPKIVDVTQEQYDCFSHVDVNIPLSDFTMPFPTLLVNMPQGRGLHRCALMHQHKGGVLTLSLISPDNLNDIITVVRDGHERNVDECLCRMEKSLEDIKDVSVPTLRVACNMALALSNFGHQAELLFPKEVEQDQKLSRENSERGQRAKQRLQQVSTLLKLDHEVQLYHREGSHESGDPTGREMQPHWRRGHWAIYWTGIGHAVKIRKYRKPTLVRRDRLTTDPQEMTTTYHR